MDEQVSSPRHQRDRARPCFPRSRALTRRAVLRRTGAAAIALGIGWVGGRTVAAHEVAEAPAAVALPPDVGQTELEVYVEASGHTVRGMFLDYWRANGAASVFGNPISEPFDAPNGYYSQAFERGILQYLPEFQWSEEPIVRLMPIFDVALDDRLEPVRRDGRRGAGGGDRRDAAWRPLAADGNSVARTIERGGVFVEETAHTIAGDLLAWYQAHEGHFYLGHPVSQAIPERGVTMQYFEGGLLMAGDDGARLAPIGAELATRLGLDTAPVERGDLPIYNEHLFLIAGNPNPLGDVTAPGRKWIEISLAQQQLWAYQGETLISSSLVSTGLAPNTTGQGLFHLRLKYVKQDMKGFTDETGEVVGFGDEPPEGTETYEVKDVPHVMYFSLNAEALHGAYWHNNFGVPMSHGCVNQPLDFAAFMFGWAPLGTMVWVHE